ncbi:MAG TPA: thioredoxin family protein [Gemmatimonadales bacterium]|nr:thioredoxin family protein [Gemmatimonadales bacterium]
MTTIQTEAPKVVSRAEWLTARKALLQKEKELTYLREVLAQARRQLPRVAVEKDYSFDSTDGPVRLADLFQGRSQLLVYHFMFHPDWVEGCRSCSYLADHFDGTLPHLAARDVTFVAVSRARLEHLTAFRRRMGWKFTWVSSHGSDFNFDYHVSFTPELLATGEASYNFESLPREVPPGMPLELPGASVFYKDENGAVYHTYSTYARGLDALVGTYQWLDLVPKGRDEEGLKHTMAWVRHHDRYENSEPVDADAGYVEPASRHECCT